ncbi:M66 family metalloprotease [Enterovibrio calviensis]|uniref:M66 family metalloprotease n=1 Tax=Enterovibrio calviensis TaxID=91359 RepID=UPI0037361A79
MKKKQLACLITALLAGVCSTAAFASPPNAQTVYFNQKALPSDTQGTLAASVSMAQSVIMPTVHGIEGDRQPHVVALRKTLVIFEPHTQESRQDEEITVVVKNRQGTEVHRATMLPPSAQPKPTGQIDINTTIVVPESCAHRISSQHAISAIAGTQGQAEFNALLTQHGTLEVATSNGNFAYDFMLPEGQELDGKIVTFSSQAGYNSTIRYSHGVDTLSQGNRITYNNVGGLWYAQSDVDYGKLAYSDKAYTTVLPAEVIEPGLSLTFSNGDREGIVESIKIGANTTLIINTVDVGLLTEPRGEFRFMTDEKLHRDYFQSIQISKLIVNPYAPIHLEEIMLPDGRLLVDVDPSEADAYGSDSHYRIARELISSGINSANYGVNSADVMNSSVWNISAPYHAAQVTVNNAIGNYSDGLITHGMLGSYAGVASVVSSTGNEFSHEVGHEFGAGTHAAAHYLGGFAGSVHNRSTNINATWGWNLFDNTFLPNLSKGRNNGSSCYEGQCAEPFEGHSFGWGTMAGGWPLHPNGNEYTLHTPYELNVFQGFMESKANFDPSSPTGFSKWNKETQTMQPWGNNLSDDLNLSVISVSGNNELAAFGPDNRKFHELFETVNAVRIQTGNGHWARDFYLPADNAFEGKIVVFSSSAGYNSHIHIGDTSILLSNGNKHAFRFASGQWTAVENDILDKTVARIPEKQGVAVTTLVGYYDPENTLPSYLYPALHGAYGAVYVDNFSASSCQLDVLTQKGGTKTYNLHNRRFKEGLMNRFHINVESALSPYRAEVYCDNQLLTSITISAPQTALKAGIVTTELGEAPTISGVSDITLQQGDVFNALDRVTAFDAEDGDMTANIEVFGNVDPQTPGSYVLTYRVTDSEGQTVSVTRTVTVEASAACIANWGKHTIYVGGDKVSHNHVVWLAGWWTKGEEPGTTGEWGVWKQTDDNSCGAPEPTPDPDPEVTPPPPGEYPTYQPGLAYQEGDIVKGSDNKLYQCKPWPNSGWCSNPSYAPGTTPYWQDAWNSFI